MILEPYDHQMFTIMIAKQQDIIAHIDCGLGKTFIATELFIPDELRTFYVTRKLAKTQVQHFIFDQYGIKPRIPRTIQGMTQAQIDKDRFFIVHYEMLNKIRETDFNLDWVIFDESQQIKNPKTFRSKNSIALSIRSERRICMSGTPTNKIYDGFPNPEEIWNQFKALRIPKMMTHRQFRNRYTEFKTETVYKGGQSIAFPKPVGLKNKEEYLSFLFGRYIRFSKQLLGHISPDSVKAIIPLSAKHKKAYKRFEEESKHNVIVDLVDEKIAVLNVLERLSRLRRLASLPPSSLKNHKLEYLKQHIEDSGGQAYCIFTYFINTSEEVYKHLHHKYGSDVVIVNGRRNTFETGTRPRIIIGTIGSLGTAIDLPWIDNAVFYDMDWSLINMAQAKDRIDRSLSLEDQGKTVYYLIGEGTVDEIMFNNINESWSIERLREEVIKWANQ